MRSANWGALGGDDDGDNWGGADMDVRDLRVVKLFRADLGLEGLGRTGEDDSAPDWKMLLSSQPLSSAV